MSAHTLNRDLGKSLNGSAKITKVATGGTIAIGGRDLCVVSGFGAGTFKLPDVPADNVGILVRVIADGAQTWQTAAGGAVNTLTSGQIGIAMAISTTSWVMIKSA